MKIIRNLKINTKITISLILLIFTIIIVAISVLTIFSNNYLIKTTKTISKESVYHYSNIALESIKEALYTSKQISILLDAIIQHKNQLNMINRTNLQTILHQFIEADDDHCFVSMAVCLEPNVLDGQDNLYRNTLGYDKNGQFAMLWFKDESDNIIHSQYDGYTIASWYETVKVNKEIELTEPFLFKIGTQETMVISIISPIISNENYVGAIIINVNLNHIQKAVEILQIDNFPTAVITFYSQSGVIIGSNQKSNFNKNINEVETDKNLIKKIITQEDFTLITKSLTHKESFIVCGIKLNINEIKNHWMATITIPEELVFQEYNKLILMIIILSFFSLVFVMALIRNFIRRILKPLQQITTIMKNFSEGEGDLTIKIPNSTNKDEIGILIGHFNSFIEKIKLIILNIKNASIKNVNNTEMLNLGTEESLAGMTEIAAGVNTINKQFSNLKNYITNSASAIYEVSKNIESLNKQIENQSSAVTESSASVTEIISSISNVAEITKKKREAATQLINTAKNGGEKINNTNSIIENITKSVDDILEMITIINDIASQTDLLSMNAAIEAAHAGEFGKSFAIVADEIRKLAESAGENAKNISGVLKDVVENIKQASESSIESRNSFDEINKEIIEITNALEEVTSSATELSAGGNQIIEAMTLLSNISVKVTEGSSEMKNGTNEISNAMQNVNNITEEVFNGLNEILIGINEINNSIKKVSSINNSINESSENLSSEVNKFKLE